MEKQKILVITKWAPYDPGAGSARIKGFIDNLRGEFDLKVIAPKTTSKSHIAIERLDIYRDGVNFLSYIRSFFVLKKFIKSYKPDVIFASYPTIALPFLGVIISTIYKITFILDSRDLEGLVLKQFDHSIKASITLWLEKLSIKYATRILVTTETQKELMQKFYNADQRKITIIPNGTEEVSRKRRISKKYDLVFYGSLNPERDPDRVFKLLATMPRDWKVLFIGTSEKQFARLYSDQQLKFITKRISIIGPLSQEKTYKYLAASKIGFISMTSNMETSYQMPVKIFDYITFGLPVLILGYNTKSYLRKFIEKNNIGFYLKSNSQFIAKAQEIRDDKNYLDQIFKANTKFAKKYSRTKSIVPLIKLIKTLK